MCQTVTAYIGMVLFDDSADYYSMTQSPVCVEHLYLCKAVICGVSISLKVGRVSSSYLFNYREGPWPGHILFTTVAPPLSFPPLIQNCSHWAGVYQGSSVVPADDLAARNEIMLSIARGEQSLSPGGISFIRRCLHFFLRVCEYGPRCTNYNRQSLTASRQCMKRGLACDLVLHCCRGDRQDLLDGPLMMKNPQHPLTAWPSLPLHLYAKGKLN